MVEALTVTRENALLVTGMSWREVLRLAKLQGIPIVRVSKRRQAVDGLRLRKALEDMKPSTKRPAVDATDQLLIDLGVLR